MKSMSGIAIRHPEMSFVFGVVVALFFLACIPNIQTIDNVDYFTVDDDPDFAFHKKIKEIFGDDEFFVISFKQPDIFTQPVLRMLKDVAAELEAHPGIRDVQSLGNVDYVDGAREYFEVRKFLESVPATSHDLEVLRGQALTTPLYLDNLISQDGSTAALVVYPYDRPEEKEFRAHLLGDVRELLSRHEKNGLVFHLAGNTVTNVSLSRYVQDDLKTFIPLTYAFIAVVIWIFFRNARLTVLALLNISVCVGSTMGCMALMGVAMHNVTSVVPSLVMALALADTVHIFSCLDKKILDASASPQEALAHILSEVFMPCFLTTLTTAVGFLSLAVSAIPPIREFAYVASMGMVFEFFFSFVLLPPLLLYFNPNKIYREMDVDTGMGSFLLKLNNLVSTRNIGICVLCISMVFISLYYTKNITVETNLVEYFNKKSDLRKDLDFVQENLSGVSTLDISVQANELDAFTNPENLLVLDEIQEYVKTLPGVDTSVSFADYIKEMNKSFHDEDPEYYSIPEQRDLVAQYLLLYDSDNIDDYVNTEFDHARILVRISENSSARQAQLIKMIRKFLSASTRQDLDMRVTGSVVRQVNVIQAVTNGLVSSLALALGVIALIMFAVLRSFRIGLLSLIPNLFPLILNFGVMGMLRIPLDTSTALISVVALGIAVDDTIHFLTEYNVLRNSGLKRVDALEQVMLRKGKPILTTSLILCIGFGVLVFSNFVPTFYFGLLSALVMLTALAGDVFLLPAIMHLKTGKRSI
ncbi:MAG: RND family transporter [Desulfomicrobium sp.]